MRTSIRCASVALASLAAFGSASAQQGSLKSSIDRTVMPPPAKPPVLRVPAWTKAALTDGARLVVVEQHDLPLVSFTISFEGGVNNFVPADKVGLGSFLASMLTEGTTTKTGDQLSNAMQMLGTNIAAAIGGESGSIG